MVELLSSQDKQRVEAAIREVERETAGEIVVIVAGRSAPYDDWRGLLTALLTVGAALVAYLYAPQLPGSWVIAGQVPVAAVLWWMVGRPGLLRRIVPDAVQQAAVAARARQLFIERGLTETRERSGVLILISALEHRVELLADKGIHARAGVEEWQADVALIVEALRGGRPAEGLCEAIARIGKPLAEAFPVGPEARNELPNEVVQVR